MLIRTELTGDPAPNFRLKDQVGAPLTLADQHEIRPTDAPYLIDKRGQQRRLLMRRRRMQQGGIS